MAERNGASIDFYDNVIVHTINKHQRLTGNKAHVFQVLFDFVASCDAGNAEVSITFCQKQRHKLPPLYDQSKSLQMISSG